MRFEKLGFTGTQRGITTAQSKRLRKILDKDEGEEFHHGDCIGADENANDLAWIRNYKMVIHPPNNRSKRAFCIGEYWPQKSYLERNRDIVNATDLLIACPGEKEEQLRSGTWSTIRYADRLKKPIIILYPDGTWEKRNWT